MNEAEFAYRIRQALDEGTEKLDYTVQMRLQKARRTALDRAAAKQAAVEAAPVWVPALQADGTATLAGPGSRTSAWAWRAGWMLPVLALALGILGIQQWQNERMISDTADLDLSLLLDDTPISTLAHQGFGEYLLRNQATPIPAAAPQESPAVAEPPAPNLSPAPPPGR